jgi:GAF domain-containing protein
LVRRVDALQYMAKEGPCLDTLRTGETNRTSLDSETRWPRFREPTIKEGVVSCLALPLVIGNHGTAGVLNLYSRTRPFEESDEQVGDKFALQASAVVANARAFTKAQDLIEQLQEALKSRDLIGQAKGIIEVREHCGPEEAFERLRSMSQHRNVKLRDLSEAIVKAPDAFLARKD